MAAGVNALQSVLDRISKKAPLQDRKISVVFYDAFTGEYDLPPEEKLNKSGVLLVPRQMDEAQWELYNAMEGKNN